MKCKQYWPEVVGSELVFGDLTVTLKSTDVWSDFVTNYFMVSKVLRNNYSVQI